MRRILKLSITCLVLLVSVILQGQSLKTYSKCKLKSSHFIEELPTEINNGAIIVQTVWIEGVNRALRFILDSGSSYSYISEDIADKIGFVPSFKTSVTDGNEQEQTVLGLINLQLGSVLFSEVGVGIDESVIARPLCNIDGVIGYNVMKTCLWKLEAGRTVISDQVKNFSNFRDYNKDKLADGPLIIAGFEDGYRATMLLDLGDNATVVAATSRIKYIRQKKVVTGVGQPYITMVGSGYANKNEQSETALLEVPGFEFGGKTVSNMIVYTDDNPLLMVDAIGSGILNYFNLILDFPGKQVYSQNIASQYINKGFKTFGFKCECLENKVCIRFLWNSSAASKAGLHVGDEIERINQVDMKNLLQNDACHVYEKINTILNGDSVIELKISGCDELITLQKDQLF